MLYLYIHKHIFPKQSRSVGPFDVISKSILEKTNIHVHNTGYNEFKKFVQQYTNV